MTFLTWAKHQLDTSADTQPALTIFAVALYFLAFVVLMGTFIPRVQSEASAACFRGTTDPVICSYPSTRPKCNDYRQVIP